MAAKLISGSVAATLAQAIDILRIEAAAAYYRLTRELNGMSMAIEVEGERFRLQCVADHIVFAHSAASDVRVTTTRGTILALIDGNKGVMECILSGDLDLWAEPSVLPNVARATVAFAEGALRSHSMRALLISFRRDVSCTASSAEAQNFRSTM